MESFIVFDTEDNSAELMKAGRSGFEKKVTQLAAIGKNGERFHLRPNVKRKYKSGGFTRYEMDFAPFWSWLESQGPGRIYAHNLKYDLGNLWADYLDAIDVSSVGNRVISARWKHWVFLDSFNIWPMALKKLAEPFGMKKGVLDAESKEYVFGDCEITRKAMGAATRFAFEHGVEPVPATLGGLGMRIWKAMGGDNWFCARAEAREAYYGGRVELFCQGGEGNILYCDINSLYPYVMTKNFPAGCHHNLGMESETDVKRALKKSYANLDSMPLYGIAYADLEIPKCRIAPLPVRRDDGAIEYPWGRVKGYWTLHEIKNAMNHGAKVKRLDNIFGSTKAFAYYRGFIERIYAERKNETDPARSLFLKLLMNTLYGQLGMSGVVGKSLVLDNWILKDADGNPVLDDEGEPRLTREGTPYGSRILADIQMPLPDNANYLHAAYVTSYARLEIARYLRQIPPDDLIYTDTDSVMFFSSTGKPPFEISKELGAMKLEATATHARVDGPKMYRFGDQYKAKGIPKRKGRNGKFLPQEFMETGRTEFEQPFGFRESVAFFDKWKKKGIDNESRILSVWRKIEKYKRTQYDKKLFKNGYFYPKQWKG